MSENMFCWKPLELNSLPKEKVCRMCGQPSHLLPLNEHIVFWVHRGKELERCTDIAFRTSYLGTLKNILETKKEHLKNQISTETKTPCEKTA